VFFPKPNAGFTINNPVQCINGNKFIYNDTSTVSTGTLTRIWNFGTNNSDTSIVVNMNKTYLAIGTYSIKLISNNNGCKDSLTKNIIVNPKPTVGFAINNASQCVYGNNFIFIDTSNISSGTISRQWNFGSGVTDTSTSSVSNKTYSSANTYSVKLVSSSNNGCKDSVTKNVIVNPKPNVGFTINNAIQCVNGNKFLFTDTSIISSGIITRQWNFGSSTTDTSTSSVSNKTYSIANTYSVKMISTSNNGCKDSITKTVMVNPKPTVGYTQNNFTQCLSGNNFSLNDTSTISSGTISRKWKFSDGDTSTSSVSGKNFTNAGIYSIKLFETSDHNCTDSAIKTFTIYPQPKSGFIQNNSTQCLAGNSFFFDDTTSTAVIRLWNLGDLTTNTKDTFSKSYISSGIYNVKLKITDVRGCTDSISKQVTVKPNPAKPIITALSKSQLQSSAANSYQWYLNNKSISGATSQILILTSNGNYNVRIDSSNGCNNLSDPFSASAAGIETIMNSDEIKVYPNPFHDELKININSTQETIITITDISGKTILKINTTLQNGTPYSIAGATNLCSGFYFMKLETQNSSRVVKIVKE